MKKLSHISFWNVAVLVLSMLAFGVISTKTFAAGETDYRSFVPAGCNPSSIEIFYVTGGNASTLTAGGILANIIVVVDAGVYSMVGDITMGSCGVLVANGNTDGNVILNFPTGKSIVSSGVNDIVIRGFDATHRLEFIGITNALGIKLQNVSGATVSYTTLSGFTLLGGIGLLNTKYSNISYNTITNNKYGVIAYSTSTDNTISNNTITNNNDHGMWIHDNSNNTTISNNTISNNTGHGLYLEGLLGTHISSNTIQYNSRGIYLNTLSGSYVSSNTLQNNVLGIYVIAGQNNNFSNNTINNNTIGVGLNNSKTNTFTNNTITSNTNWGVALQASASGNIFTGGSVSSNTNANVYFSNSHYNTLSAVSVQSSIIGMQIDSSTYNTFDNVNVANNTSGTKFSTSSNNTIKLTNNTNGIYIDNNSHYNNILNTQIANQNNIFIMDGSSNNIITGGIFSTASTTTTSVWVNFINNNIVSPMYSVTGNGLSGTYENIDMTGLTGATIQFTAGTNETKNIIVTYNNNNKHYDSIVLNPSSGGGNGGGGGGGGGGGTLTCTSSNLVCVNGIWVRTGSTTCQGGNLGNSCTVTSGSNGSSTGSISGSPFSNEMNQAYLRAFANGITTMNTIQKANMTGYLLRSHMAKMISNFAITLGGLTPNTGAQCNFTDISSQSAEMKFYIKLACQLGLMGQGMTKFNPSDTVTRAQFGTILSRMIRGDRYEGGVKYYTDHLAALKREGIMTQISNPSMKEIRGYVMIMMKRVYEGGYLND